MQEHDPIISFLAEENILDGDALQAIVEKQQKTGQSLLSILKADRLLDENQLARVTAVASKIEFVTLSPDMIDPMVAHLLSMIWLISTISFRYERKTTNYSWQ